VRINVLGMNGSLHSDIECSRPFRGI
jgi:hypothetical protein